MAANNPFADLLSSCDNTPDSAVNENHASIVNNPFLSAIYEVKDSDDNDSCPTAAAVVHDDPWSNHTSTSTVLQLLCKLYYAITRIRCAVLIMPLCCLWHCV